MAKVFLGRILHQDKDFVTVEVGRRDDVEWNLSEGDQFITLVFPAEHTEADIEGGSGAS